MKTNIKICAMILALLTLLSLLASCGSTETETETDTEATTTEATLSETASEAVETEKTPSIEKKNYNTEFFLNVQTDSNYLEYHWVEEAATTF